MTQLIIELAETRETVKKLLNELQIETYLFETEPKDNQWEFIIECALEDGWETVKLKADKTYFKMCTDDALSHQRLLDDWKKALSDCKIKKT